MSINKRVRTTNQLFRAITDLGADGTQSHVAALPLQHGTRCSRMGSSARNFRKEVAACQRRGKLGGGGALSAAQLGVAPFTKLLDDQVENRNEKKIQNGRHEHSAEDGCPH